MKTNTRKSIAELAAEARQRSEASQETASLALEAQDLSAEDRAHMTLASVDNDEISQALKDIDIAGQAITSDPMVRHKFLTAQIAILAGEEKPDPEVVLSRLFSALAQHLPKTPGNDDPGKAIPLFKSWDNRDDARKHCVGTAPISLTNMFRKGRKDTIKSGRRRFLSPCTVLDRDAFNQMRDLLNRSTDYLVERLDNNASIKLRDAVWLAANLVVDSEMASSQWMERMYSPGENQDKVEHKKNGRAYYHFVLSNEEHFLLPLGERSKRLFDQLKALAES